MARPEKNTVEYFPLYCKEGKGMFFIESKYGNDGYATWIKILTQLAVSEYHYINLSDEVQLMFLSAKCKIDQEKLCNIIVDLCKLGEFDSELWTENKIIFSEKFIESIKDVYDKRTNDCICKKSLGELLIDKGILKQVKSTRKLPKAESEVVDNTQTKLNYTKLDKTILLDMWKKDFEAYKQLLRISYKEITENNDWIKERQLFHPNLDIVNSVKKSCIDFWQTESGWKNKIKSRTTKIDWKVTFNHAITQKSNQVWLPRELQQDKPVHQARFENDSIPSILKDLNVK